MDTDSDPVPVPDSQHRQYLPYPDGDNLEVLFPVALAFVLFASSRKWLDSLLFEAVPRLAAGGQFWPQNKKRGRPNSGGWSL